MRTAIEQQTPPEVDADVVWTTEQLDELAALNDEMTIETRRLRGELSQAIREGTDRATAEQEFLANRRDLDSETSDRMLDALLPIQKEQLKKQVPVLQSNEENT